MKKVYMTKGLPASGKTTWAKELVSNHPNKYKRINKDDLRLMMDGGKFSKGNEKYVIKMRNLAIMTALESGYHVIVDDTNLEPKHEQTIREMVKGIAEVEIADFTGVDVEVCLERDRKRPNYVGESVILGMFYRYIVPTKQPWQAGLPTAIIVDMDGTLAKVGDRSPYDGKSCAVDTVNSGVRDIVENSPHRIIIMSGRSEDAREATEKWLSVHLGVDYDGLIMRPEGDQRPDYIVKEELYIDNVLGRYNIVYALDDRDQVIRLWRRLGITAMQVGYGAF